MLMRAAYLDQRRNYLTTIGVDASVDDELLMTALTHKSYAMDYTQEMSHHERLEFLGDAVLGSCIATMLYHHFPDETEATLSLYKIALVREETLARVGK
jgi:ribonuclease-3